MRSEDKLEKKIYTEYSEYLDQTGVSYNNNQNGFHVYIPLQNIKQSFTRICRASDGRILLTDYCGTCYTGVRLAKRVAKAIREQCPDYDIAVEHYGASFEIDVYYEVEYESAEELHRHVLGVAHVVDVGAGIGKEMLGKDFER